MTIDTVKDLRALINRMDRDTTVYAPIVREFLKRNVSIILKIGSYTGYITSVKIDDESKELTLISEIRMNSPEYSKDKVLNFQSLLKWCYGKSSYPYSKYSLLLSDGKDIVKMNDIVFQKVHAGDSHHNAGNKKVGQFYFCDKENADKLVSKFKSRGLV